MNIYNKSEQTSTNKVLPMKINNKFFDKFMFS